MNALSSLARRFAAWFKGQYRKRPKPVWMLVAMDVLIIGLSLMIFALFHHVLPRRQASLGLVSSRDGETGNRGDIAAVYDETDVVDEDAATEFDLAAMTGDELSFSDDAVSFSDGEGDETSLLAEGAASDPLEAPEEADGEAADAVDVDPGSSDVEAADAGQQDGEPEAEAPSGDLAGDLFAGLPGDFADVFPDKFTDGEVVKSNHGYKSANVNVELKRYTSNDVVFYVADIYVRDINCLVTAFAENQFGKGIRASARDINQSIGGVIAVNGDYYGGRDDGIVIRNGELFRADPYPNRDVCVLFWDGTMETYGRGKFDAQAAIDNGAYQAWNFGPRLLNEKGKAKTRFNSDVVSSNPRTALGYYEPGHYCFVVVDGRSDDSGGLRLNELAALMQDLGCVRAYNMDGGNTSIMVVGDRIVNHPSGGGRFTSDIIAVVDKQL